MTVDKKETRKEIVESWIDGRSLDEWMNGWTRMSHSRLPKNVQIGEMTCHNCTSL